MPWPSYSERIMHHTAAGTWNYTVPAKMRVVITDVSAVNTAASVVEYAAYIAGVAFAYARLPASGGSQYFTTRAVAYQGEVITLYIQTSGVHASLFGYGFSDLSGRTGPPAAELAGEVPPLDLPPWD